MALKGEVSIGSIYLAEAQISGNLGGEGFLDLNDEALPFRNACDCDYI